MTEFVELEVGGPLSRKACATVIENIIKFIAYNNQQIPYTYDRLQQLVVNKRRRAVKNNGSIPKSLPLSISQVRANCFYEEIEAVFLAFQTTFKCIEEELVMGNTIKEVVVILGSTLASPKHMYRIQIPELLQHEECDSKMRSHLFKIYRSILSSTNNQFSGKCTGLTKIFFLINGDCKASVERGWFLPKFNFRISMNTPQTLITFVQSTTVDNDEPETCQPIAANDGQYQCSDSGNSKSDDDSVIHLESTLVEEFTVGNNWYIAKKALSGFHDKKIDGVSAYNIISDM